MAQPQSQVVQPPQPSTQPKILRIGVIQAGRIIEEKLIRRHEDVSIGSSTRNTITIFTAALPRTFTLFERLGKNRYALNFTDSMDGRVSVGDRVMPLQQVAEEKVAKKKGDAYQLPLDESSRGKVVIGEVTLLFQFVTPPPPRPRPQLPASVRGGVIAQMDWLMATTFLIVGALHLAFVFYLRSVDWPKEIAIDQIPDRFVKDIVVEKPKPVEKQVEIAKADEGKKAEEKGEDKKEGGKKRELTPEEAAAKAEASARAAAERRARLADELSRVGALKLLGSTGGKGGAVADLLNRGDPGGDADRAFQGVGGVGVASSGGGAGLSGRGGSGSGKAVGIEGLRTSGPGEVGTGERAGEKEVKGTVREETPDVDGTLDASIVAKEVRKRLGAVRTCYERSLKRNPQLAGKITICVSIAPTGGVSEAHVDNDTMGDNEVGSCIVDNVKRWRFPAPEGGSVEVCYPFVFTASQ
jgi:hypothetical protein